MENDNSVATVAVKEISRLGAKTIQALLDHRVLIVGIIAATVLALGYTALLPANQRADHSPYQTITKLYETACNPASGLVPWALCFAEGFVILVLALALLAGYRRNQAQGKQLSDYRDKEFPGRVSSQPAKVLQQIEGG